MWKGLFLGVLVLAGCSFEPLGGLLCEADGERDGDRVCREGIWTNDPSADIDASDASNSTTLDMESDWQADLDQDVFDVLPDAEEDAVADEDVDECVLGTNNCDENARCVNTSGSFTCTCNPGYAGDGINCERVFPVIVGQAGNTGTDDELTVPSVTPNSSNDLYLAVISIQTILRQVDTVEGLGLTWQRLLSKNNGASNERLEVWTARGNTSGGDVEVSLTGNPFRLAVSVLHVANAGSIAKNATDGSGAPSSSFSYAFTPATTGALLIAANTSRGAQQTAGAGWVEIREIGTQWTRHMVMTRENIGGAQINVAATFSATRHWTSMVLEIPSP